MKAATLEFLRQRFADYYRAAPLSAPPSVEQREWAFVLFDPGYPEIRMRRHIGYPHKTELFEYIRSIAPAHLYYSSAYYGMPHAPTMGEKEWLGADLIFDLDADHLVRGPYDQMLARVKEETGKLIAMLTGELGFNEKEIYLVFSGGRGYHIHIRDIAVRGFGSAERRELVDYVCGIGLDPGIALSSSSPSHRGWRQRYIGALTEYLMRLESMAPKEAIAELSALEGVGKLTAEEFLKRSRDLCSALQSRPAEINLKDVAVGKVIRALSAAKEGPFLPFLQKRAALADEPVTTDTKRLIRLPSSLHGGSGFRVTPVPVRDLSDFDPLDDAVIFGTRPVRVDSSRPVAMPLLGEVYDVPLGESTVPEALAVFLCCRGLAEIGGGETSRAP
jgi:DNA primase small subunit